MNWAAHPWLYQWTHWWHWLTYGQNATGLGFIGLAYYVIYTRQMMRAAEQTRRGTLTPVIVLVVNRTNNPNAQTFTVLNIGGPALNILTWVTAVPDDYVLDQGLRLQLPGINRLVKIPALAQGERKEGPVPFQQPGSKVLYAAQYQDVFGTGGQMRLIYHVLPDNAGILEQQNRIWGDPFAPVSIRIWAYLRLSWHLFRAKRARDAKPHDPS